MGTSLAPSCESERCGSGAVSFAWRPRRWRLPPPLQGPQDVPGQDDKTDAPRATEGGEEIVVTGFRASLRSAIDDKRDSDVQVDAINAEDIADFPDTNLAESLQRLPGVSIDRDNGEGRTITVRGLGGDFNRTRLNGLEALSTAGVERCGHQPQSQPRVRLQHFRVRTVQLAQGPEDAVGRDRRRLAGRDDRPQTGRPFDYKQGRLRALGRGQLPANSGRSRARASPGWPRAGSSTTAMGMLFSGAYSKSDNELDQYRAPAGLVGLSLSRTEFVGNENPQRAGFSAPAGTNFGSADHQSRGDRVPDRVGPGGLCQALSRRAVQHARTFRRFAWCASRRWRRSSSRT